MCNLTLGPTLLNSVRCQIVIPLPRRDRAVMQHPLFSLDLQGESYVSVKQWLIGGACGRNANRVTLPPSSGVRQRLKNLQGVMATMRNLKAARSQADI